MASIVAAAGCRHRVTLQELPSADIETTLFFIGDAGEPDPRQVGAPLDSLTAQAAVAPERTIIVFSATTFILGAFPPKAPRSGPMLAADSRHKSKRFLPAREEFSYRAITTGPTKLRSGSTRFDFRSV